MDQAGEGAGYASAAYAESLSEFGTPLALSCCRGWALSRPTPDAGARDAMGCYPLFCCRDWGGLSDDLDALRGLGLVCFSAVLDPFGEHDAALRERCFPDRLTAFKEHFVSDLGPATLDAMVSSHHRRDARRALRLLRVEKRSDPAELFDGWCGLYRGLCERHGMAGISAFSRSSFLKQFAVPGLAAFAAWEGPELAGMSLWYRAGGVAYYHLNACSDAGYRRGAAYGLMQVALEHWRSAGVRWADLGAGAGLDDQPGGLSFFKRGWSSGTRTAWFGGVILRPDDYSAMSRSATGGFFFPAYRAPA